MTIIYALLKENTIFYIGKSRNVRSRFNRHRIKYGIDIELLELDIVEDTDWLFWEKHYISLFKSWGFKLTNQNNGGGGSTIFTDEDKLKITLAKMGKSSGNKSRNKGRIVTKEENKKRSLKLTGTKRTEETKQKMALIRKQLKLKAKSVVQLDKNLNIINEFHSITDAVNETEVKGIGNALTGLAKTAGGYIWKYKN